jgi:hypothetical protein
MVFGPNAIADRLEPTVNNFPNMPLMLFLSDGDDLPKFLQSGVRTIAKHGLCVVLHHHETSVIFANALFECRFGTPVTRSVAITRLQRLFGPSCQPDEGDVWFIAITGVGESWQEVLLCQELEEAYKLYAGTAALETSTDSDDLRIQTIKEMTCGMYFVLRILTGISFGKFLTATLETLHPLDKGLKRRRHIKHAVSRDVRDLDWPLPRSFKRYFLLCKY